VPRGTAFGDGHDLRGVEAPLTQFKAFGEVDSDGKIELDPTFVAPFRLTWLSENFDALNCTNHA
jgi:hypothetical protein